MAGPRGLRSSTGCSADHLRSRGTSLSPATSDAYFNLWLFVIIFGDILYMLAWTVSRAAFSRKNDAVIAGVAAFVVGILLGILSALVMPGRIFPRPGRPGPSLILAPVVGALFMVPLRSLAQRQNPQAGYLPSWRAGAWLGFGTALARLVWITLYEAG